MLDWGVLTVELLGKIRKTQPLIHNLTNFVVMNSTANTILAVGASPVMAHAMEEVEEMASHASAIVLNIGTLEPSWINAMILAGRTGNQLGIPVVFDPVGAGATQFRTQSAHRILKEVRCDIIRGNSAEIFALAGFKSDIRGVDSIQDTEDISESVFQIAEKLGTTIAITGVEDLVCDGQTCLGVSGGHEMFKRVTGTGCAASAICACFAAVEKNYVHAAASALAYYGVAGLEASYKSNGPGSFQIELLNALANVDSQTIQTSIMVREL